MIDVAVALMIDVAAEALMIDVAVAALTIDVEVATMTAVEVVSEMIVEVVDLMIGVEVALTTVEVVALMTAEVVVLMIAVAVAMMIAAVAAATGMTEVLTEVEMIDVQKMLLLNDLSSTLNPEHPNQNQQERVNQTKTHLLPLLIPLRQLQLLQQRLPSLVVLNQLIQPQRNA